MKIDIKKPSSLIYNKRVWIRLCNHLLRISFDSHLLFINTKLKLSKTHAEIGHLSFSVQWNGLAAAIQIVFALSGRNGRFFLTLCFMLQFTELTPPVVYSKLFSHNNVIWIGNTVVDVKVFNYYLVYYR